jgi:hypothetical protein
MDNNHIWSTVMVRVMVNRGDMNVPVGMVMVVMVGMVIIVDHIRPVPMYFSLVVLLTGLSL